VVLEWQNDVPLYLDDVETYQAPETMPTDLNNAMLSAGPACSACSVRSVNPILIAALLLPGIAICFLTIALRKKFMRH